MKHHHLMVKWVKLGTFLGAAMLLTTPGCRFSYEVLLEEEQSPGDGDILGGDGDGDVSFAGSDGGDGDASSGGDGTSSGGTSTDGGTGGMAPGDGGAGSGGDVGSGGETSSGGDMGSGGTMGSGGDMGSGGTMGDYHVTSNAGDASSGSFRAAVDLAIASGSPKVITFDPDLTIMIDSEIPIIPHDISIIGNNTHIDFSSTSGEVCIAISGGTAVLDSLEVSGCLNDPLFFSGGVNHIVKNSFFHDNAGPVTTGPSSEGTTIGPGNLIKNSTAQGIFLNGGNELVIDNQIFDTAGNGIFLGGSSDFSQVIGNLIVRTATGIQFNANADNIDLHFNTIATSSGNCVTVGQADNADIRNNIFSHASLYGVAADDAKTTLSHNLYFMNASGPCNPCTPGSGALVNVDPLYTDFGGDNFIPLEGPPNDLIDGGIDIGIDRNGGATNNYYGNGPDMGFYETNY